MIDNNAFDGIESAKVGNQGLPGLSEGEYLLKVTDVQHLKTQLRGDAFIVEFEVAESSDQAKHPVGSKRSFYQPMTNKPVALSEITKFMWAVLGFDAKRDEERIATEVTPNIKQWTNAACTQKLLNGQSVRASVRLKAPNDKAIAKARAVGKEATGFPNIRFYPANPNPPASTKS